MVNKFLSELLYKNTKQWNSEVLKHESGTYVKNSKKSSKYRNQR